MHVSHRDTGSLNVSSRPSPAPGSRDLLTDLPNRQAMLAWTREAVARRSETASPLALLTVDLDNFRRINDSFGHDAGDAVLRTVADRFGAVCSPGDLVARIGDDEYALVADLGPGVAAEVLALRLMDALVPAIPVCGHDVFITASIGIAVADDGDVSVDGLLRDSEAALRAAKSRGRACSVAYEPALQSDFGSRLLLESDLRKAAASSSFVVHYQPIVDLLTGEVTGVEALLRWRHPERGLIPPAEFIPLAEETGLIAPIGRWVLEEACRQVVAWQEAFPRASSLTVSVNISALQLQEPGLLSDFEAAIRRSGIDPAHLKLEITESMMNVDGARRHLELLRGLGVRIAIDDFGTGYSSIAYLHRFPVDELKIDRVFVDRVTETDGRAIAGAICALAHSLGLAVTGEGIETLEQQASLSALGCEFGQGFRFSRPLPADELADLLADANTAA